MNDEKKEIHLAWQIWTLIWRLGDIIWDRYEQPFLQILSTKDYEEIEDDIRDIFKSE